VRITLLILVFVSLERLAELVHARCNTRRLLAQGGREVAPEHYPLIVALHSLWMGGLWLFAWRHEPNMTWLAAFATLQGMRLWVLMTLGARWTTRIIVIPGETLVRKGPYRFMAHPNYAVVTGEIAVLPLAFGLWGFALIFSVLNALVLTIRVRAENSALAGNRALSSQSA
jgi:methyltransferase